jgi:hypothetical protein
MKGLILLSLIGLVACNTSDTKNDSNAQTRQYEELTVSETDLTNLSKICQAIAYKSSTMSASVGQEFKYGYTQKACAESTMGAEVLVKTNLRAQGSQYYFDPGTVTTFPFTEVETLSTGTMPEFCQNVLSLTNPFHIDQSGLNAIWFTTNNTNYCTSDANHICLYIDKGTSSGGMGYQIHSTEIMKFVINGDRRGYFTERTLLSYAGCSKGRSQKTAVLK